MDRKTLDEKDNLQHVLLCHQHFCGELKMYQLTCFLRDSFYTIQENIEIDATYTAISASEM